MKAVCKFGSTDSGGSTERFFLSLSRARAFISLNTVMICMYVVLYMHVYKAVYVYHYWSNIDIMVYVQMIFKYCSRMLSTCSMLLCQHWSNTDNISVLGHVSYHYCTKVFVFIILEPIWVTIGCVTHRLELLSFSDTKAFIYRYLNYVMQDLIIRLTQTPPYSWLFDITSTILYKRHSSSLFWS